MIKSEIQSKCQFIIPAILFLSVMVSGCVRNTAEYCPADNTYKDWMHGISYKIPEGYGVCLPHKASRKFSDLTTHLDFDHSLVLHNKESRTGIILKINFNESPGYTNALVSFIRDFDKHPAPDRVFYDKWLKNNNLGKLNPVHLKQFDLGGFHLIEGEIEASDFEYSFITGYCTHPNPYLQTKIEQGKMVHYQLQDIAYIMVCAPPSSKELAMEDLKTFLNDLDLDYQSPK